MKLNTPVSQLPAEIRLLLNACRVLCNKEALESFEKILQEKLSWDEVLQKANYHGLAPILYHALSKFSHNGKIPEKVLNSLQLAHKQTTYFNINLLKVLDLILKVFNENGLSVIVLKGAILADQVYNNIALRPMSDIDLLVRREEMDRIDKLLNNMGYRPQPLHKWCLKEENYVTYYHLEEISLDIHCELFHSRSFLQSFLPLTSAVLWKDAKPITVNNHHALILSNETNLLYLCLHMARHFREQIRLIWACDISLFLQKKEGLIDWPYFWHLTKISGQENLIREVLLFVREYIGEKGLFLQDIKAENKFIRLGAKNHQSSTELKTRKMLQKIFNTPTIWGKIHALFNYFFPYREYLRNKYGIENKKMLLLWRVKHPILIIRSVIKEILQKNLLKRHAGDLTINLTIKNDDTR
jgi:hypothetical protein